MPLTASVNSSIVATATTTTGMTVTSSVTTQRDVFLYANGTGAANATAVIDPLITIAANSTTTTLGSLLTTSGANFTFTALKAVRMFNSATNDAITITSNITGFPACKLPPNTFMTWCSGSANGLAITGGNTITSAGTTGNISVITLIVS
jgi:hypothetical protein